MQQQAPGTPSDRQRSPYESPRADPHPSDPAAGRSSGMPAWLVWLFPSWWYLVRSLLLVGLCWFSSVLFIAFVSDGGAPVGSVMRADLGALALVSLLVAFIAPWAVLLRDRYPVIVCLATCGLPLILVYDAMTPLVCLPAVLATRSMRWVAVCTVATAVAVTAAIARELALPDTHQIFAVADEVNGGIDVLPVAGYVTLGLLALAVSVGAGMTRRWAAAGRRAAVAEQHAEQHASASAVLHDRLTRQEEREAIAREVHDTVAHSLGQIALQASALESGPDAGPEVREVSSRIRAAARQAGAELRGVLSTLRTGAEGHTAVSFDDLAGLLLDLQDQGTRITSTVFVSEGHTAAASLTRACYRIVQESVTNAFKHAPGLPIDIALRGAPATGVSISVRNPLPGGEPGPGHVPGAGSGIAGMTERAQLAGGTLTAGPVQGRFVVEAHLPWARADHAGLSVAPPTV